SPFGTFCASRPGVSSLSALPLHDALPILALPAREGDAALADHRVVTLRQGADEPVRGGQRRGPADLRLAGVRPAVADIVEDARRSEEHTSELQSREKVVCRLLLEKKKSTV